MATQIKTPDQVRMEFYKEGKTFTLWAKENGYHPVVVSRVLNGASKAQRGKTLEIAIKLGLKAA
ncbi:DNA-binding protein [Pasteurella multocida]|uniref:DNA-binding protein n=1 Tax=Pasteurella multocida TaxID=747 RepID=UPI0020203A92|nr:DNA-binding protein [Pasteurella multocida]MCL7758069.1 DNA-binding protein [Pasteurella multocida]MCL7841651.1 DNA-binding protein [Pasteurella multocida]HDR1101090.1 DNA-binding protein [Pasteurella multocida]HDR1154911.1 DNA-binding protein [Pasteurella multocida]HDR1165950.1 DNA-binding protein [Pasteurella multocida]